MEVLQYQQIKKMKVFLYLVLFILVLTSHTGLAQRKSQHFYFPIVEIEHLPDSKTLLKINQGLNYGIEKNDIVSVWGVHLDDNPKHSQIKLANGIVDSVGQNFSILMVEVTDTVFINDLAAIYLEIPSLDSDLLNIVRYRIEFQDGDGESLYDFDKLVEANDPTLEKQVYKSLIKDIQQVAKDIRSMIDDIPIKKGPYAGKSMMDMMDSVDERMLRSFFRYTNMYPGKYLGHSWKISETYATWLISNTPFAHDDLMNYFIRARSSQNIKSFANTYSESFTDEEVIISWSEEAVVFAKDSLLNEANELMKDILELTSELDSDNLNAWALYYNGKVYEQSLEPSKAIEFYQQGLSYFTKSDNYKGLGYSHISIGDLILEMKDYENGLDHFRKGYYYLNIVCEQFPDESYAKTELARTQYLLGRSFLKLNQYDSSIYYYKSMLMHYRELNDNNNEGIALENLAEAYGKSGNCEEAIKIGLERLEKYLSTNDSIKLADAYFDIAYEYYGTCSDYEKAIAYYELSYSTHLAINDTSNAILSRSNIGQAYWALRMLDKAIENHLMAITLARSSNNIEHLISSLTKLTSLYKENGNPDKGLETSQEIITLLEITGDSSTKAKMHVEIGDMYKEGKDYPKAEEHYNLGIQAATELGDYTLLSDTYFKKAGLFFALNQFDDAQDNYIKCYSIAQEANYQSNVVSSLSNIGLIYSIKDQFSAADSVYSLALRLSEDINDKNNIAYTTFRLAETAVRKRNYEEAHSLYDKSLSLYKELDNKRSQSMILQNISYLLLNEGKFLEAEKTIEEAKAIALENNDLNNVANCLFSLSDIHGRIFGDFDKAWENHIEAMKLYEEIGNAWGTASAYNNLGNLYNLQGDYVKAITYYNKSDSLYQKLNSQYNRASPINNIGTIYYWQADYEKALIQFFSAIKILDDLGISNADRTLYVSNVGEIYFEQGKNELATKWLTQAIEESREINDLGLLSTTLAIIGELKINQQEYDMAEKYLTESYNLSIQKNIKIGLSTVELSLGKLYRKTNDVPKARKYFNDAIKTSLEIGSDKRLWEAYYYQGLMARESGDLVESKEAFINAIETLERIQSKIVGGAAAKKIFASGEKQIMVYSNLVDVLIETGEVDLALQYLERSNVEALRNKFNQLNIKFNDEKSNENLKKERELKKKLDNIDRTLADEKSATRDASLAKIENLEKSRSIAEGEYLKFVNETINTNPELAKHFSGGYHPRKLKTDKNRRLIPKELVVLSYLPADDKLYIFAATSDTVIAKIVNVGLEELDGTIKYIYNFTSTHIGEFTADSLRMARGVTAEQTSGSGELNEEGFRKNSEQLYNWLIAPVQAEVDKKPLIAVIPTGVLNFLPFQVLGHTSSDNSFEYLIEKYTLFYSHTLEILYQQPTKKENISILAFGNADNTLPATVEEVEDLLAIYPDSEILLGEKATEDRAKIIKGNHNVLHFATHGVLDYFDYNKSYLTLAPNKASNEDGKLTIEEVWEIEDIYSYQLVTLSACSTALSNDYSTGWAVSPASSFIDAGTPTVVASLWAVNDASTALLMKYFYENLKTESKVVALRQAQIKLANNPKYSHPYYWSPFILIGSWK